MQRIFVDFLNARGQMRRKREEEGIIMSCTFPFIYLHKHTHHSVVQQQLQHGHSTDIKSIMFFVFLLYRRRPWYTKSFTIIYQIYLVLLPACVYGCVMVVPSIVPTSMSHIKLIILIIFHSIWGKFWPRFHAMVG